METMEIDSAKLPGEERQLKRDVETICSWTADTFRLDPQPLFDHFKNLKVAYQTCE